MKLKIDLNQNINKWQSAELNTLNYVLKSPKFIHHLKVKTHLKLRRYYKNQSYLQKLTQQILEKDFKKKGKIEKINNKVLGKIAKKLKKDYTLKKMDFTKEDIAGLIKKQQFNETEICDIIKQVYGKEKVFVS